MGRKSILVTQALLLPIDSVVQFAEQQNLAPVPHPSPDFHLLLFLALPLDNMVDSLHSFRIGKSIHC